MASGCGSTVPAMGDFWRKYQTPILIVFAAVWIVVAAFVFLLDWISAG